MQALFPSLLLVVLFSVLDTACDSGADQPEPATAGPSPGVQADGRGDVPSPTPSFTPLPGIPTPTQVPLAPSPSSGQPAEQTVTIDVVCFPANDPGNFEISLDLSPPLGRIGCGESLQVPVDSNSHEVWERREENTGYHTEFSNGCKAYASGPGTQSSARLLGSTCTITYTTAARAAQLTINLVCVPSDDPGTFVVLLEGHVDLQLDCPGAEGLPASTSLSVSPQAHRVAEMGRGEATDVDEYDVLFGGDCVSGIDELNMLPSGLVNLTPGGYFTCIITNMR